MFDIVKQTYGKGNTKTARFEGANFKTGPNHKTLGHRSYVMATPSITDLQSLVNRLTADNNRLRNLVKLYEASFAAMKPGKYYVCSDDGEVSSSYWKSGAAEQFATELAADGTGATVVLVTRPARRLRRSAGRRLPRHPYPRRGHVGGAPCHSANSCPCPRLRLCCTMDAPPPPLWKWRRSSVSVTTMWYAIFAVS